MNDIEKVKEIRRKYFNCINEEGNIKATSELIVSHIEQKYINNDFSNFSYFVQSFLTKDIDRQIILNILASLCFMKKTKYSEDSIKKIRNYLNLK